MKQLVLVRFPSVPETLYLPHRFINYFHDMLETLLSLHLLLHPSSQQHLPISSSITLVSIDQTNHLSNLTLPTPTPTPALNKIVAKATPKPKPAIATPAPADLEPHYQAYADQFNVSKETLTAIAKCESRHNPQAISRNQTYGGLYQFSASTWISTRNAMNADPNPELRFNAEEAIKTAAFKIASGGIKAWANCSKNV
jgi:hypothetical protein